MSVEIDQTMDIVPRLREFGGALMKQAADEIERLRAINRDATRRPAEAVMVIGLSWSRTAKLTSSPVVIDGVLHVHVDGDLPVASANALTHAQEVDALREEVAESMRTVMRYHKGNTSLLVALADVVEFMPEAIPRAVEVLSAAGVMQNEQLVDRAALDARRACPISWEVAVRTLVKQPDIQAGLLAMGAAGHGG